MLNLISRLLGRGAGPGDQADAPRSRPGTTAARDSGNGAAASRLHQATSIDSRQGDSRLNTGGARNLRHDLLRLALRDVLRVSGMPVEWLSVEAVSTTSRSGRAPGVHVRLVLRTNEAQALAHLPSLEQAYLQCVAALDPAADEWLRGVSWRLDLPDGAEVAPLPDPASWRPSPSVRADLERLLAAGDHASARRKPDAFAATEPMSIS